MILLKKQHYFIVFLERAQLPHDAVLGLEERTFHCKILSKHYRNIKFNISVILTLFYQSHKNFRVSRNLVKDVQGFGQFTNKHFKL